MFPYVIPLTGSWGQTMAVIVLGEVDMAVITGESTECHFQTLMPLRMTTWGNPKLVRRKGFQYEWTCPLSYSQSLGLAWLVYKGKTRPSEDAFFGFWRLFRGNGAAWNCWETLAEVGDDAAGGWALFFFFVAGVWGDIYWVYGISFYQHYRIWNMHEFLE